MVDVKQAIKEAHEYADKAIRDSMHDTKDVQKAVRTWLNAGNYHLTNVHVLSWIVVTALICIIL